MTEQTPLEELWREWQAQRAVNEDEMAAMLAAFDNLRKVGKLSPLFTARCDVRGHESSGCLLARGWQTPSGRFVEIGSGKLSPGHARDRGISRRRYPRRLVRSLAPEHRDIARHVEFVACDHRHLVVDVDEMFRLKGNIVLAATRTAVVVEVRA